MNYSNLTIELLLIASVVVFVVDLSGWRDSLLGALSRFTRRYGRGPVRSFKPITCSLCLTWWTGLVWIIVTGQLTLPSVALVAAASWMTDTLSTIFIFIRETITSAITKIDATWQKWMEL